MFTVLLAANVPSVDFAEPVNALAQESSSRVLALSGYECEATLVAGTTGVTTTINPWPRALAPID